MNSSQSINVSGGKHSVFSNTYSKMAVPTPKTVAIKRLSVIQYVQYGSFSQSIACTIAAWPNMANKVARNVNFTTPIRDVGLSERVALLCRWGFVSWCSINYFFEMNLDAARSVAIGNQQLYPQTRTFMVEGF